jgi:hypothetical protein
MADVWLKAKKALVWAGSVVRASKCILVPTSHHPTDSLAAGGHFASRGWLLPDMAKSRKLNNPLISQRVSPIADIGRQELPSGEVGRGPFDAPKYEMQPPACAVPGIPRIRI